MFSLFIGEGLAFYLYCFDKLCFLPTSCVKNLLIIIGHFVYTLLLNPVIYIKKPGCSKSFLNTFVFQKKSLIIRFLTVYKFPFDKVAKL